MEYKKQIERIKRKLGRVMAKHAFSHNYLRYSNYYKLDPPLSEGELANFEQMLQIRLPSCYRTFLKEVGSVNYDNFFLGAGPYSGLLSLERAFEESKILPGYLKEPSLIHPDLTEEEWTELLNLLNPNVLSRYEYEKEYSCIFQGLLSISSGEKFSIMIVLNGEHRGRIVKIDKDNRKPLFTCDNNFLDWYEEWLDGIINNYQISKFGCCYGGDEKKLIELYNSSASEVERLFVLKSMTKFTRIDGETASFIKGLIKESNKEQVERAMELLSRACYSDIKEYLEELLASGKAKERLYALNTIFNMAKYHYNDWPEKIIPLLAQESDEEIIGAALRVLDECSSDYGRLLTPLFNHESTEIRAIALNYLRRLRNWFNYLEKFNLALYDEEPEVVVEALLAVKGLKEERLLKGLEHIMDNFKENRFEVLTNTIESLSHFGQKALPLLKRAGRHPDEKVSQLAKKYIGEIEIEVRTSWLKGISDIF